MSADAADVSLEFSPDKRHSVRVDAFERVEDELHFEVRVRVHRFTAHTAATASIDAVRSWISALEQLYDTLAGAVVLEADLVNIRLSGDGRGHVALSGEVRGVPVDSWGEASLRFTVPGIDQTFLPPAIAALLRALALQPGDEDE